MSLVWLGVVTVGLLTIVLVLVLWEIHDQQAINMWIDKQEQLLDQYLEKQRQGASEQELQAFLDTNWSELKS